MGMGKVSGFLCDHKGSMVTFQFDLEKTIAAIAFLAERNVPDLDKYKVGKLLFLADKYHLVRYGRTITGDGYCAMDHGPAPSSTLNLLKALHGREGSRFGAWAQQLLQFVEVDTSYQYPRFRSKQGPNLDVLSESDLKALRHIVALYGQKTFAELKAITHEMPAYQKSRKGGSGKAPRMKFEDFFEEDSEAREGIKEEMLENFALQKAFPSHCL
jgi:uncharacterized phage-associated protein